MYKTLTTSVAAIALMTGAAFAQSETETETDATTQMEAESSTEMSTDSSTSSAEEMAQDVEETGENTADAAEEMGEDIAEGAENTAESAQDMAEDAANATADAASDAAEATANAAENAADAAENGMENAADKAENATDGADNANDVARANAGMNSAFSGMVVGDLLGMPVTTQNGEDVGEIDYVVEQSDGLAAVIGIGGFLGLGEYTVAIPLEEFSMASDSDGLKLSSWTETELKDQPEFDETGVEGLDDDVRLDNAM